MRAIPAGARGSFTPVAPRPSCQSVQGCNASRSARDSGHDHGHGERRIECDQALLRPGQSAVGTRVDVSHLAATRRPPCFRICRSHRHRRPPCRIPCLGDGPGRRSAPVRTPGPSSSLTSLPSAWRRSTQTRTIDSAGHARFLRFTPIDAHCVLPRWRPRPRSRSLEFRSVRSPPP